MKVSDVLFEALTVEAEMSDSQERRKYFNDVIDYLYNEGRGPDLDDGIASVEDIFDAWYNKNKGQGLGRKQAQAISDRIESEFNEGSDTVMLFGDNVQRALMADSPKQLLQFVIQNAVSEDLVAADKESFDKFVSWVEENPALRDFLDRDDGGYDGEPDYELDRDDRAERRAPNRSVDSWFRDT